MASKVTSRGLLITCDVPTKQYILFIAKDSVLHDLDETHLFIDPAGLPFIKEKLKKFSEENAYSDPQYESKAASN